VGYFGSIVLTRARQRVTALPHVDQIGFRHVRLRELGEGWQVLETSGADDPPDLVRAVGSLALQWSQPILAAYVSDGGCAQVHWGSPDRPTSSVHLPRPHLVDDCGYEHRPTFTTGRRPTEVGDDLADWAGAAGLSVSRRRLDRVVAHEPDDSDLYLPTDLHIFELVRALGFPDIPPSAAYAIDPTSEPFDRITMNMFGLGFRARSNAAAREQGYADVAGPVQPWEQAAVDLETDIFAAAFGDGVEHGDLLSRALWVHEAELAARARIAPPPLEVSPGVTNTLRLAADMADSMISTHRLRAGQAFPDPAIGTGVWPELDGDDPTMPHP
jgi:hypothetical protein